MKRLALGGILLLLAATASSCGTALPTAPSVDSGVSAHRSAGTNSMSEGDGSISFDEGFIPAGGQDQTKAPPAGEVIVPTPGATYNGTKTGWWSNVHRRHNK